MAKAKKDNELRIVRAFSAPIDLVWEAFTDVGHQENWWGPRGFTITSKSKDLRPGGQWIYTMHGPDGVDYPNIATYHVVEKPFKLVYDHGATENTPPLFRVTVTFEEFKGKTVMDMTMTLETPEAAREIEKFIKQAGGNSTWDRFGEYLEKEQSQKDVFIINRSFKASPNELFEMWVNPEHLSQWLTPTDMVILNSEVRINGCVHFSMANPGGPTIYGLFQYLEKDAPVKLVYTQSFCDENQVNCKPPFASTWPDTWLNTVTFLDEGEDEMRVTVKCEIYGRAIEEEHKTFLEFRASMAEGWTRSFDKLEELL